MGQSSEAIDKRLGSANAEDRTWAWLLKLYKDDDFSKKIDRLFLGKTGNLQDVHDLRQELLLTAYTRLKDKQLPTENPAGYIFRSAQNLLASHQRRQSRIVPWSDVALQNWALTHPDLVLWPAQSDRGQEQESHKDTALARLFGSPAAQAGEQELESSTEWILGPYLESERDRRLALLRLMGYKPDAIRLFSLPRHSVQNDLRRIDRKLQRMNRWRAQFLKTASPWEQQLSFTGDARPIGVTWSVYPRDIAPESVSLLLEELELESPTQIFQRYASLVRFDGVKTRQLNMRLCFTPQVDFIEGRILEGETVYYKDFAVKPHRVKENGGWRTLLYLGDVQSYSSRLVGNHHNDQGAWVGWDWYFPEFNAYIRKAVDEKFLHSVCTSEGWADAVGIYQFYRAEEFENIKPASN